MSKNKLTARDIVAAGTVAAALATTPAQAKTQEAVNSLLPDINPTHSITIGGTHSNGQTGGHAGVTLGNDQLQFKIDGQKGNSYDNVFVGVNANGERVYFIGGVSASQDNKYGTTAHGTHVEVGRALGTNGMIHDVIVSGTVVNAKDKVLNVETIPYPSSQVIGQTTSKAEEIQGNQKTTYTHTDTTIQETNGIHTKTTRFTGGHETRVSAQVGFNTTNNGISSLRVDHHNSSQFGDKTVATLAHTQYTGNAQYTVGADTEQNIFARVEGQVGKRTSAYAGVNHNIKSGDTGIVAGVRYTFDGPTGAAPYTKPTNAQQYGNARFREVDSTNGRYAAQNPLNYGRIVTTSADKQTVTVDTKRDTTKTVETIKHPVDITALDNFMKSLPGQDNKAKFSRIIDLTNVPEWFTITDVTARTTDDFGPAVGTLEVKKIGENIYDTALFHTIRWKISSGKIDITFRDKNGDIHTRTYWPLWFISFQIK